MDSPRCVACQTNRFVHTPTHTAAYHLTCCQQCGTAFTDPRPSPTELEAHYDQQYYGQGNVKFISTMERLVQWLTRLRAKRIGRLLAPGSRVLEVGCGRGLLLQALSELGHECHGTERSELAALRARKAAGLQIYTSPLEENGLKENYFDLVILWHVLEHLDTPATTLSHLHRLLKAGGLLLVEVPNFSGFQARLFGKHWFHLDTERHLFHFTRQGLQELLGAKGFQVLKTTTFNAEQCPYGVLQSLFNAFGFPREQFYRVLKKEIAVPFALRTAYFLFALLLVFPAAGFSLLEALLGRGGVTRVKARKMRW
jgi:2-polyprenyl-3-methyl-5-hydroxy-6-metoxy-1,4-benzoquinol methylase